MITANQLCRNHCRRLTKVFGAAVTVLLFSVTASAVEYRVGPGQPLSEIEEVPWELLEPGDRVLVDARPDPYRAKWVIARRGTADAPITITGGPDAAGSLPVIYEHNNYTNSRGITFQFNHFSIISALSAMAVPAITSKTAPPA